MPWTQHLVDRDSCVAIRRIQPPKRYSGALTVSGFEVIRANAHPGSRRPRDARRQRQQAPVNELAQPWPAMATATYSPNQAELSPYTQLALLTRMAKAYHREVCLRL